MEQLIASLLAQPISVLSLVALIVIVFFQLVQMGLIDIKIGREPDEMGGAKEKVPVWAKKLIQYANHDMTENYAELRRVQQTMLDLMREHNKLDEKVIAILEEQKEYGVRCRRDN